LDTSRDKSYSTPITKCQYGSHVGLTASQHYSSDSVLEDILSVTSASYAKTKSAIKKFERIAKSSTDKNVISAVQKMTSSQKFVDSLADKVGALGNDVKDEDVTKIIESISQDDINKHLAPTNDTYFTFDAAVNNISYEIYISDGTGDASASDKVILSKLKQLDILHNKVVARTKDSSLSQEPAAYISGSKKITKYGTTTLLDVCNVLSKEVFKKTYDKSSNDIVKRYNISSTNAEYAENPALKEAFSPRSSCSRGYVKNDELFSNSEISVKLNQSASDEGAKRNLDSIKKVYAYMQFAPLETKADTALLMSRKDNDYMKFIFRVGPYVIEADAKKADGEKTARSRYLNRSETIQLINLLTEQIPATSSSEQ